MTPHNFYRHCVFNCDPTLFLTPRLARALLPDPVSRAQIGLCKLKFLILDEADRMLDMGFMPDIRSLTTEFGMPGRGECQSSYMRG